MGKSGNRTRTKRIPKRGALHVIASGTFENLPEQIRTRPGAKAMVTAYAQRGPCMTKDAIGYALALPDKPRLGTLKKYDGMLKQCGAIVPLSDAPVNSGAEYFLRIAKDALNNDSPASEDDLLDITAQHRSWENRRERLERAVGILAAAARAGNSPQTAGMTFRTRVGEDQVKELRRLLHTAIALLEAPVSSEAAPSGEITSSLNVSKRWLGSLRRAVGGPRSRKAE